MAWHDQALYQELLLRDIDEESAESGESTSRVQAGRGDDAYFPNVTQV